MARLQLHEGFVIAEDALDEHLNAHQGLRPVHASADHAGIVEDREVACLQQRWQIGKSTVDTTTVADVEETAAAADCAGDCAISSGGSS